MKNKILGMVGALLLAVTPIRATDEIQSTFSSTADGTKSATAFVPAANGFANVTDISYDLDTAVATGTIDIRQAEVEKAISSATSASGTVFWFDNDPTIVSAGEYIIFYDASANQYYLNRCNASSATSITVYETITPATTTSDKIYSCLPTVRRHAVNVTSESLGLVDIWLPADLPSALTIDGNTTSCRISINGKRVK